MIIKNFNDFNKINENSSYDKYLNNEKFMKYFNKFKKRILELFPNYNMTNVDLLIDEIYNLYYDNYPIDDAINNLYIRGWLFNFRTTKDD